MQPTDPSDESIMRARMAALVVAMKNKRAACATGTFAGEPSVPPLDEEPDLLGVSRRRGPRRPLDTSRIERAFATNRRSSVLERGTRVGRYVVLRPLGVGGMGAVYAAYDPELDRKVALKLLLAGAAGSTGRARLLREAQALAKLSHPNVVAIHDVGSVGDQVWLAMELVRGQTLREWLQAPRGWQAALEVMREAGKGLAAAHAAGLLHRDFKPDNVMVGDDGRVRVMDFGLARARPNVEVIESIESKAVPAVATLAISITQPGALVGTPFYMAPEQIDDAELTPAVDQFAFCLTLWEVLHGERPFGGKAPLEIFTNVLGGRLRSPSGTRAVPSWLRRACERGLSIEPGERWPSMDALLQALEGKKTASAKRRGLILGAGAALVAALMVSQSPSHDPCDSGTERIGEVWGAEEAIALAEELYGPEHPSHATELANAGAARLQQGDVSGSEALFRRALEIRTASFGPTHPSVLETRIDLARVVSQLGRQDEAIELLQDVEQNAAEADAVQRAELLVALSGVHSDQGRFEEADAILRRVTGDSGGIDERRGGQLVR